MPFCHNWIGFTLDTSPYGKVTRASRTGFVTWRFFFDVNGKLWWSEAKEKATK